MPGGRPALFKDNEELRKKVEEYFKAPPLKVVATSAGAIDVPVITISGLAYHLGFESRQSFYDYEKNKEFSYTIKRARLFIEKEYEEQLKFNNTSGAIFALKNFGWKDKQEIEHSGGLSDLTEQEIDAKLAELLEESE